MDILIRFISILLISVTLTSCSVNPVTGKKELLLISASQEISIGETNYQPSQQAQGGNYYIDPQVANYVNSVGQRLAAVSDRPDLPYEFVVLNNSTPNAWALPGGKIAINRGLINHLHDESELAAVLGHEIVHAAARHGAAQMTRNMFIGAGAQLIGIAASETEYGALANIAIQLSSSAWLAKYGRDDELESDAYGMDYMIKAGYNPQGAVRLQETFVKLNNEKNNSFLNNLFASHPPSQERVDANKQKAANLASGIIGKEQFKQHMAQIIKDAPAYVAHGEALALIKDNKPKQAITTINKALKIQPKESSFYELRGHAQEMLKQDNKAEQDFTTAINYNPEFYSHYLSRGTLYFKNGDRKKAQQDLERSHKLLATQPASYMLGEISFQEKDIDAAQQYYQAAMQGGGDIGKQALSKYTRIELPKNPAQFIASQPYIATDGYLKIMIKNNAVITVVNVQVRLDETTDNNQSSRSMTLTETYSLKPNEQLIIPTLIGPFTNTDKMPSYHSQVINAQPTINR